MGLEFIITRTTEDSSMANNNNNNLINMVTKWLIISVSLSNKKIITITIEKITKNIKKFILKLKIYKFKIFVYF
jgi:hypothetical protein